MVVRLTDAAAAYANAADSAQRPGLEARDTHQGGTFGAMVREQLDGAVEAGRAAERVQADAVMGNADLSEVVMAVNNAEVTLQAVVSVRDRMIQAYQEIMRMPI